MSSALLRQVVGAAVGLSGHRHEQEDPDQHERRDDRAAAGRIGGVLGLLVDRHPGVPAPEQEHAEQHAEDQRVEADRERVEPVELDVEGACPCRRGGRCRRLISATTAKMISVTISKPSRNCWVRAESSMPRQQIQVSATMKMTPRTITSHLLFAVAVAAEQLKAVGAGDLGLVGVDDDVGEDHRPAADPAPAGAHRPAHPRERGPAVGVGLVHVAVGPARCRTSGMKETMITAGMWPPMPAIATMKPIVAARL